MGILIRISKVFKLEGSEFPGGYTSDVLADARK